MRLADMIRAEVNQNAYFTQEQVDYILGLQDEELLIAFDNNSTDSFWAAFGHIVDDICDELLGDRP